MKTILIVIGILAAIAVIVYWRSRPTKMTGEQFAAMLHDAMPRSSIADLGRFYFNNGSWWQEKPCLVTPDGKPITILFNSSDGSEPTQSQRQLVYAAQDVIKAQWDDLRREFVSYFKEMDDPATWDQSQEWEINIDEGTQPTGWTVSFKVLGGHAAWYSKDYQGDEGYSAQATY